MKNTKNDELAVCGFAAVKMLEKNGPERITRFYFTPLDFFGECGILKLST